MVTRRTARWFPAYLGVLSVAVTLGSIVLAMAVAPWFSLLGNALSDLGARGAVTAPLFNGALMVGGALGAGFFVFLWPTANGLQRAALLFGLLAMVAMALVGVFPIPSPFHALVAVPFFVFVTIAVFCWGAGDYAAGRPTRGLVFVLLGSLHVVSWAWWYLFPWLPRGIAIPELVGSAALAAWVCWVSVDLHRDIRAGPERL